MVKRSDSVDGMVLGGLLLLLSATGLLHLSRGRPGLGDGVDELGAAGGALGVGVGGFLHAWTAAWGSVLLLVFAGLIGAVFFTGVTVQSAAKGAWSVAGWLQEKALRPAWRLLRTAVVNLFSDIKEGPGRSRTAGLASLRRIARR